MGGVELCGAGYVNTREGFPYLVIELVASGNGQLVLDGRKHKLTPGTVFCYGPDIAHEIRHTGQKRMVKFFVVFQGAAARSLLDQCSLAPGSAMRTMNVERTVSAFESLIGNGCAQGPHCREICALSLETLLLVLADTAIPDGASASKALSTFELARTKVDDAFLHLRDLSDIAKACKLDPSYLCRLFRRFAGTTPYRYLLGVKMRHAAQILRSERIPVNQLARRLGYDDPYQFSRVFKRIHGLSPENYALLAGRMF